MAVANPCHQKEWNEWKEQMEENRRRRWREKVRRWAKVELSDEEEDGEEDEAEDTDSEEEEVSKDEEENEAGEKGEGEEEEEMGMREAEDMEEEGDTVKETKKGDREVVEAHGKVDMEEEEKEEAKEVEREVKENEEVDKDEEKEMKNVEQQVEDREVVEAHEKVDMEEEGENVVEREVKENEEVDKDEEKEVKNVEQLVEMEEGGEDVVEREDKENEEVDKDEEKEVKNVGQQVEDREVVEVLQKVDMEEEGENVVEREVKENEEVDKDEEKEVKNVEQLVEGEEEGENVVEREVKENKEVDKDEEKEVKNVEQLVEGEEGGENEVGVFNEDEEVELVAEKEATEAEEMEEEGIRVENEVERENGGVEEKEVMEAEEIKEEQEEGEDGFEWDVKVNEEVGEKEDRQVREEEQEEGEDDGEVQNQDQGQIGQYHLQNKESRREEDETFNEEGKLSDSVESDNEDSDLVGSEDECYNFGKMKDDSNKQQKDPEELEDPYEKSQWTENSVLGAWSFKERKEEESEKLTNEEEAVAESWTTQEKEFQDDDKKLHEEKDESADDEDAEHSDEDADSDDEDVVKIYCKEDYHTHLFDILTEFRDSFLLTDLTLSTEDGGSFHVHSLVLAAVSSLIRQSLSRSDVENYRVKERKDDATNVGVHNWSVTLGPEVDHVGLEAVVEFAYTGLISRLNKYTVHQIKAAAQTLGAPRVLGLCMEEEEKSIKTDGQKKEERISAADQMMISLQSIKKLWMDRVGCDVILEAIRGSLHVHRVILAVLSDFFRGMFTLGMKESHQRYVSLPCLLASELEVLIDCSYSGALPLSWRCVFEITSTALQLQYQPALSLCLKFLHQEINPHSCLDVASFAKAYEMVQLLEVAEDFVLRQFEKVACTAKFQDLPAKQLLKYLNSHSLCVPSELVVFKAVVAWIQAKPKYRLKLAKELMKTIHFPLMTFKEFKEVRSLNMWSDHSLAELYEAVFEDFCSNETAPQTQCRIYMPKESLVLIGGDQISADMCRRRISREIWFGNSLKNHTGIIKDMEWRRLGEMPEPARYKHEVTVLDGQLYVIGGKKYYGISDTLNSVYRYDPLQNSWESLAEMQEKRCSFSAVVLDGKIYAIGGHCDPDCRESVERYCPTAKSWRFTCSLDLPLSGHVAKVLQGQIFVSGGLNNDQCLSSMFLYHPETGSTYLANMAKPRAHHCMDTLGGCLYVAGGITTDENMTFVDQLACEVYNPVANSWTAFTSLPVPHVGAGSAVLEGKFYVLGGYSQEDDSDTTRVHRYDPTTQRWENMGRMPGPNNDIRASVLCLPSHLRL